MRMIIGRHFVRRPPHDLVIWGYRFTSDFHSIADAKQTSRHFAFMPKGDISLAFLTMEEPAFCGRNGKSPGASAGRASDGMG